MLSALIVAAAAAVAGAPAGIVVAAPAQLGTAVVTQSNGGAAPGSVPLREATAANVICKRFEETGSRTGARKLCLTRSQWAEVEEGGKSLTEAFQAQARATQ